jgi:hypothetical protein
MLQDQHHLFFIDGHQKLHQFQHGTGGADNITMVESGHNFFIPLKKKLILDNLLLCGLNQDLTKER